MRRRRDEWRMADAIPRMGYGKDNHRFILTAYVCSAKKNKIVYILRESRETATHRRDDMMRSLRFRVAAAAALSTCIGAAHADDWVIHMTVDNQFDAWFGTPFGTNFHAGSGNSWPTTYTFNAFGRATTDYLYVSTASDHAVAQGFIGDFTNTTTNMTTVTGDLIWEVFPAGRYLSQMGMGPGPWPPSLQPTQAQVDTAILYATTNNLWLTPYIGGLNGVGPWGARPGISSNARWIWHRDPNSPFTDATQESWNHEEFLVFRIAGAVPAPGSLALVGAFGVMATRRRR